MSQVKFSLAASFPLSTTLSANSLNRLTLVLSTMMHDVASVRGHGAPDLSPQIINYYW
jgi:hypothetical protein